jgi:hypothetical protein
MGLIDRFQDYADAFEVFFASDDASVLEPYFTGDAVYETRAEPPFAARHEGREKIIEGLRRSIETFDKRFETRTLEILEGPTEADDSVWMRWRVTYTAPGVPPLVMVGEETATFAGDRIARLEDRFPSLVVKEILAWMNEHGGKLAEG